MYVTCTTPEASTKTTEPWLYLNGDTVAGADQVAPPSMVLEMTIGELFVRPFGVVLNWVHVTYATRLLLGSAPTHSLSLRSVAPAAALVSRTKCVVQVAPLSVERLTATEFAASPRLKARFAYQNVFEGPAATEGAPADS